MAQKCAQKAQFSGKIALDERPTSMYTSDKTFYGHFKTILSNGDRIANPSGLRRPFVIGGVANLVCPALFGQIYTNFN